MRRCRVSATATAAAVLLAPVTPSIPSPPPSRTVSPPPGRSQREPQGPEGDKCVFLGPEGWGTAGVRDTGPTGVLFRWSPKHQDLEVISTSSLPAYLKAPGETESRTEASLPALSVSSSAFLLVLTRRLSSSGPYLGNQLLSYGQNLSFSLRMDHSVRQPSYNDVILEGGGLQVAASLGGLLSAAPCRQKMNYTFRCRVQPVEPGET